MMRVAANILRERALVISQPQESEDQQHVNSLALIFIGGRTFGFPLKRVKQAAKIDSTTDIPGGASFFIGITVVESQVVSLIDLSVFFGIQRRDVAVINSCLILSVGSRQLGVAAEAILGQEDVLATVAMSPTHSDALSVANTGQKEIFVVDVNLLFSDSRLVAKND